jgi:uncharacterized protein
MLNELFTIQNRVVSNVSLAFKRYLSQSINWDHRLIIIKGGRGTGKTTLVLQHYLEKYDDLKKCLYISADNPLILKSGIYQTGVTYFKYYGDCLIIDEVHKQKDWSLEIKALYDAYPDKKFIVLGSSALNILSEKGDLSRRGVIYTLPVLSFREYLELKYKKQLDSYTFAGVVSDHVNICSRLMSEFRTILGDFTDYTASGSYPFFLGATQAEYLNALSNVIDKIIYEDIPAIKALRAYSSLKLKKLLAYLATSSIPLFNIESLKVEIEVSKDTLYDYFDLLNRADILEIVRTESKNMRVFKNSKILFKSPNTYYAIAYELWKSHVEKGNIRESFFASQTGYKYRLFSSAHTDFLLFDGLNRIEIEVGGKRKKKKQIKNLKDAYIFKDDIEIGAGNSIPLYLAGFLY